MDDLEDIELDELDQSVRPDVGIGLVDEPEEEDLDTNEFENQLQETLRETEEAVLALAQTVSVHADVQFWHQARAVVEDFKPVPWFIWRLSNFVFARPGRIGEVNEGLVFGMRRLMFAAASDPALGAGEKVNNMREALRVLTSDVVASVSVIHAICRRLSKRPFERIWRPILDDALLRARIGLEVGIMSPEFGPGRGMIAGFAGRCGLAILISSGELDDARKALEMLATGAEIREVGMAVYKCDPLQVSAMTLSACGCGRNAAFGTVSYASGSPRDTVDNDDQLRWLAAFTITEAVRMSSLDKVHEDYWQILGFEEEAEREELMAEAKKTIRRGHGWNWLVG